jgi:hypothetical protein
MVMLNIVRLYLDHKKSMENVKVFGNIKKMLPELILSHFVHAVLMGSGFGVQTSAASDIHAKQYQPAIHLIMRITTIITIWVSKVMAGV